MALLSLSMTADATTEIGEWPGGVASVGVEGGFGSGTLTIKSSKTQSGANLRDLGTSAQLTAAGVVVLGGIPAGHYLFAVLSGSTAPTIEIDVERVYEHTKRNY